MSSKPSLKTLNQIYSSKPIDLYNTPFKNINPNKFNRYQQPFDVNNLPNKRLEADPNNTPKMFKEEYSSLQPIATVAALEKIVSGCAKKV